MIKRLLIVFLGTTLGGWLAAHLQFGISGFWGLGSDELSLVGMVSALAAPLVSVLYPLSRLAERRLATRVVSLVVPAGAILASLVLGLWFYLGLLSRPLALALGRDFPFILCFAIAGIGYAVAYRFVPNGLTRPSSGPPAAAAHVQR